MKWIGITVPKEKKNKEIDAAEAISYRTPLVVDSMLVLDCGLASSICPRCDITLDREYQSYCDRCGQKLSWKGFSKAKMIPWAEKYGQQKQKLTK